MERLTKRTADGILVKEDYREDVLRTLYQCYGAEPTPHYSNCDEGYCAMEKLEEYAHSSICKTHEHGCPYLTDSNVGCENCGAIGALEIVKSGGIE